MIGQIMFCTWFRTSAACYFTDNSSELKKHRHLIHLKEATRVDDAHSIWFWYQVIIRARIANINTDSNKLYYLKQLMCCCVGKSHVSWFVHLLNSFSSRDLQNMFFHYSVFYDLITYMLEHKIGLQCDAIWLLWPIKCVQAHIHGRLMCNMNDCHPDNFYNW